LDPIDLNASINATLFQAPLNVSINATLNPAPPNLIKDWLPSIISVVVVIVGGFMTYFGATKIEERRREYELKEEVYFEVLNAILDLRRRYEDVIEAKKKSDLSAEKVGSARWDFDTASPKSLSFDDSKKKNDLAELLEKLKDSADSLKLIKLKLEICSDEKVSRLFGDAVSKSQWDDPTDEKSYQDFKDTVFNELIPVIKEDMFKSQKHLWEFWK
jgi:hypothetical protein